MSHVRSLARVVEFKLLLATIMEDHVALELRRAAREQKRRLPPETRTVLRTGAIAAVNRLTPAELLSFAGGATVEESLLQAMSSGAFDRLVASTVRLAFPGGPT